MILKNAVNLPIAPVLWLATSLFLTPLSYGGPRVALDPSTIRNLNQSMSGMELLAPAVLRSCDGRAQRGGVTPVVWNGRLPSEEIRRQTVLILIRQGRGIRTCSGEVLSNRSILTGAHCVSQDASCGNNVLEPTSFTVIFGDAQINVRPTNPTGELVYPAPPQVSVSRVIRHPQCHQVAAEAVGSFPRPWRNENDLAILQLYSDLPEEARPVRLPSRNLDASSQALTIAGRGVTRPDEIYGPQNAIALGQQYTLERNLRTAPVQLYSQQPDESQKSMLLVYDEENQENARRLGAVLPGDSGGAVFARNGADQVLLGVISTLGVGSSASNTATRTTQTFSEFIDLRQYVDWLAPFTSGSQR